MDTNSDLLDALKREHDKLAEGLCEAVTDWLWSSPAEYEAWWKSQKMPLWIAEPEKYE